MVCGAAHQLEPVAIDATPRTLRLHCVRRSEAMERASIDNFRRFHGEALGGGPSQSD